MSEKKECKCRDCDDFTGGRCKRQFPEQRKAAQKVKLLSEVIHDDLTSPTFNRDAMKGGEQ